MSTTDIIYDMPEVDYFAVPAASNSRLSALKKSPAHMKARELYPKESRAFDDGTIIHMAVLEHERFLENGYVRGPVGDRRTKAVKEEWKAMLDQYEEWQVLPPKTYDMAHGIAMNVRINEHMMAMLDGADTEVSIFWEDQETGVQCKARIDCLPRIDGGYRNSFMDLKSAVDASPHSFSRHMYRYGYHRQMAMYNMGLEAVGMTKLNTFLAAVEKTPPYAIGLYRVDEGALDAGEHEIRKLLRLYAECEAKGEWPAYSTEPVDITIPSWAYAEVDDYITEE